MRKIKVISGQGSPRSIESDATSWGALKLELSTKASIENVGSLKAVVSDTKVTLEDDAALLPTGNFTLFLFTTKKMASGIDLSKKSFGELGKLCTKATGVPAPATKAERITLLEKWFEDKADATNEEIKEYINQTIAIASDAIDEIVDTLEKAKAELDEVKENVDQMVESDSDIAEYKKMQQTIR